MRAAGLWQWTTLPPLPLEGLGTAGVESLDSYVVRLAATQGLTPVAFLDALDRCSGHPPIRNVYPRSGILGPGARFMDRLGTLERLTGGQLLKGGTFYALSDVLRRQHSGLSATRRWCSLCLADMEKSGVAARLSWALSELSACSVHGVLITDACLTCGAAQPYTIALANRQTCRACDGSLIAEPVYAHGLSKERQWIDKCIEELIAYISGPCPMIPPGGYERYLARVIREGDLNDMNHDFPSGPPSLGNLLRLSAYMSVPIMDILIRDEELPSKRLIIDDEETHLVPLRDDSRLYRALRIEMIAKEALRSKISPLPSMKLLLERNGLRQAPASLTESVIYRRYIRKYKVQGVNANGRERKALFESIFRLVDQPDGPSMTFLVKHLSEAYRVSPQIIRKYIKSALFLLAIECAAQSTYMA